MSGMLIRGCIDLQTFCNQTNKSLNLGQRWTTKETGGACFCIMSQSAVPVTVTELLAGSSLHYECVYQTMGHKMTMLSIVCSTAHGMHKKQRIICRLQAN
jgi:hypothetical protein